MSSSDVQSFVSQFGNQWSDDLYIHSGVDNNEGTIQIIFQGSSRVSFSLDYYNQNGKLEQLALNIEVSKNDQAVFGDPFFQQLSNIYQLPNILSVYGKPTSVLIYPILYEAPFQTDDKISLVLLYTEQGFLIEYIFPKNDEEGDVFVGCPLQTGYLNIVSWFPAHELEITYLLQKKSGIGLGELNYPYYKSIEESTSMTIEEFYENFTILNDTCLRTPGNLWFPN